MQNFDPAFTIISLIILFFSIIFHEISHGYMADWLGDPTARLAGRLTLNPIKHIDPIGSIIVPVATFFLGGFAFGWAKPVPYNPYNLKNKRQGEFLVAVAGPASNLLIAVIFGTIIRFMAAGSDGLTPFLQIAAYIVVINISLAVFNLVPIPPLDGSKLLLAFLPNQYGRVRMVLERYGLILVFIAVLLLWPIISPVVPWIFKLLTGIAP